MKQEIIECEERILQAFRTSDVKVLDELIHDDLIFNIPSGEVINKEMDLDAYKSGYAKVEEMNCEEREIKEFGDTAVVSTVIYLKGTFMDNKVDGRARFLRTWKKTGGRWQVVGGASVVLV